jgi:hypothetical protein
MIIDGYGSKSTNSALAGFYLLLYIRHNDYQYFASHRLSSDMATIFDLRDNPSTEIETGLKLAFYEYKCL